MTGVVGETVVVTALTDTLAIRVSQTRCGLTEAEMLRFTLTKAFVGSVKLYLTMAVRESKRVSHALLTNESLDGDCG